MKSPNPRCREQGFIVSVASSWCFELKACLCRRVLGVVCQLQITLLKLPNSDVLAVLAASLCTFLSWPRSAQQRCLQVLRSFAVVLFAAKGSEWFHALTQSSPPNLEQSVGQENFPADSHLLLPGTNKESTCLPSLTASAQLHGASLRVLAIIRILIVKVAWRKSKKKLGSLFFLLLSSSRSTFIFMYQILILSFEILIS